MPDRSTPVYALALLIFSLLPAGCGGGNDDESLSSGRADQDKPSNTRARDGSGSATDSARAAPLVAGLPDFSRLVRKVSPAVVNISAMPKDDAASDNANPGGLSDWLKRFFDEHPDGRGSDGRPLPLPRDPDSAPHVSLGSGFIISSDGYVLTNRHVVADGGQIVVKLNDRRQLVARVVGEDKYSDVAVLKIDADHLPTVAIGDSRALPVGAWVVAIGSPFGFETSVTAGIVSAKQRNLADDQYVPFLQTDVAINPGNSGGPLFNLAGEVVGVNSQIYSETGGYQGVSFAIPIDIAMNVAGQLRASGTVARGWLGVQIQDVDREMAASFGLNRPEGALVAQVLAGSPAAGADLRAGDVILGVNGRRVDSAAALPPLVGAVSPGQTAELQVLRDGDRQTLDVEIEALPKNALARFRRPDAGGENNADTAYGLTLNTLSADEKQTLDLDRGGVKITAIAPDSAGAAAGLKAKDVILAVGAVDIKNRRSFVAALEAADGPVALLVLREGVRRYLPMTPKKS